MNISLTFHKILILKTYHGPKWAFLCILCLLNFYSVFVYKSNTRVRFFFTWYNLITAINNNFAESKIKGIPCKFKNIKLEQFFFHMLMVNVFKWKYFVAEERSSQMGKKQHLQADLDGGCQHVFVYLQKWLKD